MIDENIQDNIKDEYDVRENNILSLNELSNEDLMEFYNKIDEHIKYLKTNILIEDDQNE